MPPVLYSFRRCPYAIRARMTLAYSGQTVELREVVLKNKPPEMLNISAKGTVPVLQLTDGTVIDESLDIMQWALSKSDPDNWLNQTNGTAPDWIKTNDTEFKHWLDRYKYADRYPEATMADYRQQAMQFITQLDSQLAQTPYLSGNQISLADVAVFPFIRQFAHVDYGWFEQQPYPHLQRWLRDWLNSALFTSVMDKYPAWQTDDPPLLFSGFTA